MQNDSLLLSLNILQLNRDSNKYTNINSTNIDLQHALAKDMQSVGQFH